MNPHAPAPTPQPNRPMLRLLLASLLALCAGSPSQARAPQTQTVVSAAGRYRIEHVEPAEGTTVPGNGAWRRYAADSAEGAPASAKPIAEGAFHGGFLEGPWLWRYPNGRTRMSGAFVAGRRTGPWRFFHPDGTPAAQATFAFGLRERGPWFDVRPDGSPDADGAGSYSAARGDWPGTSNPRFLAQVRGEEFHGPVEARWRDGETPMLQGRFHAGLATGWWTVWLVDGSIDTEVVGGWYENGRRVDSERRDDVRDGWELSYEEQVQRQGGLAPSPRALPPPREFEAADATRSRRTRRLLREHLDGDAALAERLQRMGRRVVLEALRELVEIDVAIAADVTRGAALTEFLRRFTAGQGFDWHDSIEPAGRTANRRARVLWLTWWELVHDDEGWWRAIEAGAPAGSAWLTPELLLGPRKERGPAASSNARRVDLPLPGVQRNEIEVAQSLRTALEWLLAHQEEDGRWSCTTYSALCPAGGSGPCAGFGQPWHDVGVTGLALLALMGDGRTLELRDVAMAVERGVGWLGAQQRDAVRGGIRGGLFGDNPGTDFIYDQAVATLALAEARRLQGRFEVEGALLRAVELLARARNPYGAWAYDLPPVGKNDTSVTGWVATALAAAERTGLALRSDWRGGALSWLDDATDPASGRIGYRTNGSPSARVPGINEHYPIDQTEALTAVGLACRLALGQAPGEHSILERHAELLLRRQPMWHPKGLSNDFYYWYHGTLAMRAMGRTSPRYWNAWRGALLAALSGSQRGEGHARGSWDPIGPWGHAGGRVYSTALGALCLTAVLEPLPETRR